jgi:hypothetical protein
MTAHTLLLCNLAWYIALFLAFVYEGDKGNALYFLGAFILTVGVYIK